MPWPGRPPKGRSMKGSVHRVSPLLSLSVPAVTCLLAPQPRPIARPYPALSQPNGWPPQVDEGDLRGLAFETPPVPRLPPCPCAFFGILAAGLPQVGVVF